LSRLGWTQGKIAKVVGLDRSVISRNVQNTKIGNMHNLLSQGRSMNYIARHYHMGLPLVWALRLEGKIRKETKHLNSRQANCKIGSFTKAALDFTDSMYEIPNGPEGPERQKSAGCKSD